MKKRILRLFVAFNGVPLLGLILFMGFIAITTGEFDVADVFEELGFLLAAAYVFSFIPALAFALVMEFVVPRYTKQYRYYVPISVLFGYVSGLLIKFAVVKHIILLSEMSLIGFIVGFILGGVLCYLHRIT